MLKQADTAAGGSQQGRADPAATPASRTRPSESVLVQSKTADVSDPALPRRGRRRRAHGLCAATGAARSLAARAAATPARSRTTGHSALVQFEIRGDQDKADKKVQPVLDAVAARADRHTAFTVAEFGFASANHELNDTLEQGLPAGRVLLAAR